MMLVQYAPLVFARTAFIDFRPAFIAAPRALSTDERARAVRFVAAAMDHPEPIKQARRSVIFRVGGYLIAGVVAPASWLSDDFTHELIRHDDGSISPRRLLHAFVGAVFARTPEPFVPPSDQQFYRDIYATVMTSRFMELRSAPGWEAATDFEFRSIEVEPIAAAAATQAPPDGMVAVHPVADNDALWRQVAAGVAASLCTNASPGSKQMDLFDVLTTARAEAVGHELRPVRKSAKADSGHRARADDPFDTRAYDEREEAKKKSRGAAAEFGFGFGFPQYSAGGDSGGGDPARARSASVPGEQKVAIAPSRVMDTLAQWLARLLADPRLAALSFEGHADKEPLTALGNFARKSGRHATVTGYAAKPGELTDRFSREPGLLILSSTACEIMPSCRSCALIAVRRHLGADEDHLPVDISCQCNQISRTMPFRSFIDGLRRSPRLLFIAINPEAGDD